MKAGLVSLYMVNIEDTYMYYRYVNVILTCTDTIMTKISMIFDSTRSLVFILSL